MERNQQIENFLSACDDVYTCKFLIAEHKIKKLLATLASTSQVCNLVAQCVEGFNRDKEFMRAYLQNSKGHFEFQAPNDEVRMIALVFCTLAEIDNGNIDFADFIKRFFSDDDSITPYDNFVNKMILPFRNLMAEAFGYPKLGEQNNQIANAPDMTETQNMEENEDKILPFPDEKYYSREKYEKICSKVQSIAVEMLSELENVRKCDNIIEELKAICYAIVMATSDRDFDIVRGLALGLKYASKNCKTIKFLSRELAQVVEEYYDEMNADED